MRALGTRALRGAKHSRNASRTSVLREYSRCLGSKVHAPTKCRIAHAYLDRRLYASLAKGAAPPAGTMGQNSFIRFSFNSFLSALDLNQV